jgi:type II secretory pathway pseudopilin PulG
MAAGAFVVVFVLIAVLAPLVLYALVRSEHDARETMDRRAAEQSARRDTPDADEDRRDGSDAEHR